jgi:hypothetical protein
MNIKVLSKLGVAVILLGASCVFATMAKADNGLPAKTAAKARTPQITTQTSLIGPATEQIIFTEKDHDGTVIRVVQILHQDGTSETSGERHVLGVKK